MANTPVYSEGRNVRRLEGNRRKDTSMMRVSCVPEMQHASFPLFHNNPVRWEWFLSFHTQEVGAQNRWVSCAGLQPRRGSGGLELCGLGTVFTLTAGLSRVVQSVPSVSGTPISPRGSMPWARGGCRLGVGPAWLWGLSSSFLLFGKTWCPSADICEVPSMSQALANPVSVL